MVNKVYEIINNQILSKLEAGVIPWRHPWTAGAPKNAISGNAYKGFNVFRLGFEEYDNPNWLTYKQAIALDGHVEKGSKSTMIIFWRMKKYEDKDSGEEKTIPMLRYYNVFNIEQTTLTDDERFTIVKNDNNPIENCESILNNYPSKPEIVNKDKGSAFYNYKLDFINMPPISSFDSSEYYYSTLFHECTHSTGAKKRLDRKMTDARKKNTDPNYWFEEIIAELGASYLGGETGISYHTLNNSASYIDGYYSALKKDPTMFIKAASAAQKAVEFIKGVKPA